MIKHYRSNTFKFGYSINLENGEKYKFKKDDKLLVAIYNNLKKNNDYITKEFDLEQGKTDTIIQIESKIMKELKYNDYTLEIQLINKDVVLTTLQEELFIKESWC